MLTVPLNNFSSPVLRAFLSDLFQFCFLRIGFRPQSTV
jgi:hypothetical protein